MDRQQPSSYRRTLEDSASYKTDEKTGGAVIAKPQQPFRFPPGEDFFCTQLSCRPCSCRISAEKSCQKRRSARPSEVKQRPHNMFEQGTQYTVQSHMDEKRCDGKEREQ